MDKRQLSLLFLAHASDVLENAFAPLNDDDYDLGKYVDFILVHSQVPGNCTGGIKLIVIAKF